MNTKSEMKSVYGSCYSEHTTVLTKTNVFAHNDNHIALYLAFVGYCICTVSLYNCSKHYLSISYKYMYNHKYMYNLLDESVALW